MNSDGLQESTESTDTVLRIENGERLIKTNSKCLAIFVLILVAIFMVFSLFILTGDIEIGAIIALVLEKI